MPTEPRLVQVTVPLAVDQVFTYAAPAALSPAPQPGARVLVPFGRTHMVGLVAGPAETVPEGVSCKEIIRVLDERPILTPALLRLAEWIADYYVAPLGSVHRTMLPPGLLARRARAQSSRAEFWPVRRVQAVLEVKRPAGVKLTERQEDALAALENAELPVSVARVEASGWASRAVLTTLVKKGCVRIGWLERVRTPWKLETWVERIEWKLSSSQQEAVDRLLEILHQGRFASALLHGVTGSGKTEVYLRLIRHVLDEGGGALVLVPEIGLTPQVAGVFRAWFGDQVAIQHSGLSDGERFDQWRRIRDGKTRLVVGTRSAVFAPVERLQLIVIDEEQDHSYKQQQVPLYNARDTALVRGRLENALVLLGSATPQLETYYAAVVRKRHAYLALPERVQKRPLPEVHVVDMREEFRQGGRSVMISRLLRSKIEERIAAGDQVLVLLNRRGYSRMILCRSCGYAPSCRFCSITLTYHRTLQRMLCHYCGYSEPVPEECPECGKSYLYQVGLGTEKLQEFFKRLFPDVSVGRLDRDVLSRKGLLEKTLSDFAAGRIQLLVGTQMIAKGHDFPRVTLVGVLHAELSLRIADFRAAERSFQLLTQVAGRSGRGHKRGEVVIETYYPDHYSLQCAKAQAYVPFFERELEFRRAFFYPPFVHLVSVLVEDKQAERARSRAEALAGFLEEARQRWSSKKRLRLLGPAQAFLERIKGYYRWQVILKGVSRDELHRVIREAVETAKANRVSLRGVRIDVDPLDLG
ncbi:MAG: primosomal protein N' [Acidobacteriota bacterium]